MEVGAVARTIFVVETETQVDDRIGGCIDVKVVGQESESPQAFGVDGGMDAFVFGQAAELQVMQQHVVVGSQFGREATAEIVVLQIGVEGALRRNEQGRHEEFGDRLQVEELDIEVAELSGMLLVFSPDVPAAEQVLQVVLIHQMDGFCDEIAEEETAFVIGPDAFAVEGKQVSLVVLPGIEGDVADEEGPLRQGGLDRPEVGLPENGTVCCLEEVGVHGQRDGSTVALVEVDGVEVDMLHIEVELDVVARRLVAQGDVAVSYELDVRVVAHQVDFDQLVFHLAGGHDAVIVISVETEIVDGQGKDADRQSFRRSGKGQVGMAGEGTERGFTQNAAQLERVGGDVAFGREPVAVQMEVGIEAGAAHGGELQLSRCLQVAQGSLRERANGWTMDRSPE